MEDDLRVAKSIQQGLLPKSVPRVPGVDLFGFTAPAREVGGDYFDWISLPNGSIGCVVADVSGKGMPAALLMAQLQAAFKAQAQTGLPAEQVLSTVNLFLGNTMEADRFVTLFYAVIDPKNNRLVYANAGHNPALLWHRDGSSEWLGEGGLMLSPVSLLPYQSYALPFGPGDGLVIYTDGVSEAEAGSGQQWGEENLRTVALQNRGETAQMMGQKIKLALEDFVAGNEQSDDITLAVIARRD